MKKTKKKTKDTLAKVRKDLHEAIDVVQRYVVKIYMQNDFKAYEEAYDLKQKNCKHELFNIYGVCDLSSSKHRKYIRCRCVKCDYERKLSYDDLSWRERRAYRIMKKVLMDQNKG